jgi:hypothetical protein
MANHRAPDRLLASSLPTVRRQLLSAFIGRLSEATLSLGTVAGAETAADRYADLVDDLMGADGVTPPAGGSGFGRSSLRFRGRIFAMLVRGRLVLKLPAQRVSDLVDSGDGVPFDANKGTPMREWLSLDPESKLDWLALAQEALAFAMASQGRARPAG